MQNYSIFGFFVCRYQETIVNEASDIFEAIKNNSLGFDLKKNVAQLNTEMQTAKERNGS